MGLGKCRQVFRRRQFGHVPTACLPRRRVSPWCSIDLDKRGYQLMSHAERRASVHLALDAYEDAERVNGTRDRRLRIEHYFVISDADAERQDCLGVIAAAGLLLQRRRYHLRPAQTARYVSTRKI